MRPETGWLFMASLLSGWNGSALSQNATTTMTSSVKPINATDLPIAIDTRTTLNGGLKYDVFDWNTLKSMMKHGGDLENIVVSPIALKLALALLYEGAQGVTKQELGKVLNLPEASTAASAEIRNKFVEMLNSLKDERADQAAEVRLGSRLFVDNCYTILKRYTSIAKGVYDTDVDRVNFTDSKAAAARINDYIKELTNGHVERIIVDEASLKDSAMVIANAVYFRAAWLDRPFDPKETRLGQFFLNNDKFVTVQFMRASGQFFFAYVPELDARVLKIPYAGGKYSMNLMLPEQQNKLGEMMTKVTPGTLKHSSMRFEKQSVDVMLPRFRFRASNDLQPVLKDLGLKSVFGADADLPIVLETKPRASGKSLHVSNILQKVGIEVSEAGTEAYAATEIQLDNKMQGELFIANHPFAFYLEDEASGALLFAGIVNDPLKLENRIGAEEVVPAAAPATPEVVPASAPLPPQQVVPASAPPPVFPQSADDASFASAPLPPASFPASAPIPPPPPSFSGSLPPPAFVPVPQQDVPAAIAQIFPPPGAPIPQLPSQQVDLLANNDVQLQQPNNGPGHNSVMGIGSDSRQNFFNIELLQAVNDESSHPNVVLGTSSVKACLMLLIEAAQGRSRQQLLTALRLPGKLSDIRAAADLNLANFKDPTGSTELVTVAKLWTSQDQQINRNYSATLQRYYHGEVQSLDFRQSQLAAQSINAWVNQLTKGLIRDLYEPSGSDLAPDTRMILTTAVYFRGKWLKAFDKSSTRAECFQAPNRGCVKTPMMESYEWYKYAVVPALDAQALLLPYVSGRMAMLVLLPKTSDPAALHGLSRDLAFTPLTSILASMRDTEMRVQLPRFTIDTEIDLTNDLQKLGIHDIFNNMADLSGAFAAPIPASTTVPTATKSVQQPQLTQHIDRVLHKAHIEVSEEGTIAAAVTGTSIVPLMGPSYTDFVANRPFLYFLLDMQSNGILFAGRLNEPTELVVDKVPPPSPATKV
ncbi:hypothetical protein TKK_0014976 [Trichogramma kaykai]